jgi:hypothetical protein
MIPTIGREQVALYHIIFAEAGMDYRDAIWFMRDPEPHPKPQGAWPFQRASQPHAENVTAMKGRRKP